MSECKIPIIIICSIDNKPMGFHDAFFFHDAFMDIKGFINPRLETVCLLIHSPNKHCEWILVNTTWKNVRNHLYVS